MQSGPLNLTGIVAAARALGIKASPPFAGNAEELLGWAGVFLLLVVAKLANHAYGPQHTRASRVSAWIARRGIDVAAVIGWLADELPSSTARTGRELRPAAAYDAFRIEPRSANGNRAFRRHGHEI